MAHFLFSVIVDGLDAQDDAQVDLLAELPEVLVLSDADGAVEVHVEIEAPASEAAVRAAVLILESAAPGVRVERIELDLVAASDIAERVEVSRQAVTNWATGRRSGPPFPSPLGRIAGGTRVWAWSQVLPWLQASQHATDHETALDYAVIVELNALLQHPRQPSRLASVGRWERPDLQSAGSKRTFAPAQATGGGLRFRVGDVDATTIRADAA